MIRRLRQVLLLALVLSGGPAYAGSWYEPTFLTGNHIDPNNSPDANLQLLLDAYFPHSPPPGNSYEERAERLHSELSALAQQAGFHFQFVTGRGEPDILNDTGTAVSATIHTGEDFYFNACNGEDFSPHKEFARHLFAARYPLEDTAVILATRLKMMGDCDNFDMGAVEGPEYRDNPFVRYTSAAKSFYNERFDTAFNRFAELKGAEDPWIREVAAYMLARVRLIQAQEDWNGYDKPQELVNQEVLAESARLFADYLSRYPEGEYARSARNLERRIAYLRGHNNRLHKMVRQHLIDTLAEAGKADPDSDEKARRVREAFREWNMYKGDDSDLRTPLLSASLVYAKGADKTTLDAIEGAADSFSPYPGLYDLTRASLAYREGRYASALEFDATTADMPEGIVAAFAVLRARSYEALHKPAQALTEWQRLFILDRVRDDDLLLGLARNYEALGRIEELAKKANPLNRQAYENRIPLFEKAFTESCDSEKLLGIANDAESEPEARDKARSALLDRYLVSADFGKAYHYLTALEQTGKYSAIETALRTLTDNPDDPKGLLNIAYFINVAVSAPESREKIIDSEGNCMVAAKVKVNGPLYYYHRVVQLHGADEKSVDEAKALHYLVSCRKAGEHRRSCGWGRVPDDIWTSKAYFQRLHSKYRGSKWAKKTRYYY